MNHEYDQHGHHTKAEFEAELTHHDDWFRHSPGEVHQDSHGSTNPWAIAVTLILLIIVTFGVAFYVLNYFNRAVANEKIVKREARTDDTWKLEYLQAKADWNAELSQYRLLDAKAGTVGLPIDAAIEKTVDAYQGKAGK